MLVLFTNSSINTYNLQNPFILLILNLTIRILEQLDVQMEFPGDTSGKEPTCQYRRHKRCMFDPWVRIPGIPWEEEMATQFSILAWRIPWTEAPGRLWSILSHRAEHDWSNLTCVQSKMTPDTIHLLQKLTTKWIMGKYKMQDPTTSRLKQTRKSCDLGFDNDFIDIKQKSISHERKSW